MESVVHAPSPQSLVAALPEIYSFAVQWNVNPFTQIFVSVSRDPFGILAGVVIASFLAGNGILQVVSLSRFLKEI